MNVFNEYTDYYDLLYKDKDYAGESEYIDKLIKKYQPNAKSILNLGCGTGNHDFFLRNKGYRITGVDGSERNVEKARAKLSDLREECVDLAFKCGDIRNIRLDQTFDIVISLFHVMSYQVTNEDLKSAFETAKIHLSNGGLFIFDCWYGPAVLTERSETRIKQVENKQTRIIRIAEPEIFPNENTVHVNYHVLIVDKTTNNITEVRETHPMRYLFKPEIDELLSVSGLKVVECAEWITGNPLGLNTWKACFIATRYMVVAE